MDAILPTLTLGARVWVICERHRLAQQGTIVTVSPEAFTVKLPNSQLPPQRYDRHTGMRFLGTGPQRSNDFFLRTALPPRFQNPHARPHYVVLPYPQGAAHAST